MIDNNYNYTYTDFQKIGTAAAAQTLLISHPKLESHHFIVIMLLDIVFSNLLSSSSQ